MRLRGFLAGACDQAGRLAGDVLPSLGDRRLNGCRRLVLGGGERLSLLGFGLGLNLGHRRPGHFRPPLGVRNRVVRLSLQGLLLTRQLSQDVVEEAAECLLNIEAELFCQSVSVLPDLVIESHAK